MDILPSKPSSLEDAYEDRKGLVDWLFPHFRAFMSNQYYMDSIYSDRLIGFALNYPAIQNGETSYARLHVQEFHLPEIKEWEKTKIEFVRTKFYHGPLLALDRVAEVVKAYKEMIQDIPNDTFPDVYAKMGLAATKAAAGVLPDLMEKHSLLKDIDRSTVDDLIYRYTPPVVRCMEEVLDALENMAMDTKSREPCPRQTCDVLSKIYQLKRKTPALTAMLMFLADKKAQQKFIWGTAAGLIVFSGIILCAAPVTAPVAALTGSAMGSTAAAGTASTAVVSTSVGAAGGTLAVARAAAFTATSAAIGGSSMTFIKSLEEMNSRNTITINNWVNESLGTIVYYIALCFMKSNGIANPLSDDDQVSKVVEKLYGRRPTHIAKKQYRAAFLHKLIRKLAKDFRKVIVRPRKLGYAHLDDLEWMPKPLITLQESTMSF
ncbi:hypothetical protein ACHAPG_010435 [Botrytis cinerea]